ncbi:MAG: rhamnogalacturonan lyase [Lachnospiraceae bacterium]|nr:rhamnogalacturonan lyase [Lachnospiraceae bacterium]
MKNRLLKIMFLCTMTACLCACANGKDTEEVKEVTPTVAAAVPETQTPTVTVPPTDTPVPTSTPTPYEQVRFSRQVENLDRGLVAVAGDICEGTVVSWRKLGTDSDDITFTLFRNGEEIPEAKEIVQTCFNDKAGKVGDVYTITVSAACCVEEVSLKDECVAVAEYIEIPIDVPADDTLRMGGTCSYYANDASVGDVDGDGEYEIILKWDPDNSKDNSQNGITGRVYIDCYKLDGTKLWRINLGENIRAGAHYTQFMVYDFDGDGKAEMICKTSDGSVDGQGNVIGDGKQIYLNTTIGKILRGNEFLTLFDGETGTALDTIDFEPARGKLESWGDGAGNRSERYLGAVAYLNGETPSCIMSRGYYARTAICAYDVVDKKLVMRWKFDTETDGKEYMGQGNHNLAVADVDGDGYDEIVFGQLTIDEDGKAKSCTGLGHGDAMHVGDLILDHPGPEAWSCLEGSHGAVLWNPSDAEVLYRINANGDTGRGTTGNFVPGNRCYEFVSSESSDVYDSDFNVVGTWPKGASVNYAVYWDSDLEHEVGDGIKVYKITGETLLNAKGCVKINGTKSNTSLTADILGDWREEIILPSEDRKSLRIYLTPYATDVTTFTLMHDTQYRCQIASQNVAYNQGALTSFFLGTGFDLPEMPKVFNALVEE